MIYLYNLINLKFRGCLKTFNKGYRYYNQKLDFDKILAKNYEVNLPFTFVQVGANDGVSFDNLYEFVTTRKSEGLVIEPLQEYFEQLDLNYAKYPKIIRVKKAVHPTEKEIAIYKVAKSSLAKYPDWAKGIASLDREHHLKINIDSKDITQQIVQCEHLMEIIKIVSFKFIDFIQIDTEGFDLEVLKMIDFNVIKPSLIKYESVNLSAEDRSKAKKLLTKQGYFHYESAYDSLAINLKKIKLDWK